MIRISSITNGLLWVFCAAATGAPQWQHQTAIRTSKRTQSRIDSLNSASSVTVREYTGVRQSGDTLPALGLRSSTGDTVSMNKLAERGYRVLYFYRPDCSACEFTDPPIANFANRTPGKVALIRFDKDSVLTAEPLRDHYGVLRKVPTGLAPVLRVPSLLTLNSSGIVVQAAQSDSRRVLHVLASFGAKDAIDELDRLNAARKKWYVENDSINQRRFAAPVTKQ